MSTNLNLISLLKENFGFDSFRPNQKQIILELLAGKDVMAIMPTGGGKSLCYQLPALALPGTTLVISPLIALMKDQVDALLVNGIKAAYYNSSQPPQIQTEVLTRLREGKLDLFYLAPESLPFLLSRLVNSNINLIAIDEAHCISSWGHDFRPAYTKLRVLRNKFPEIPILALTATADRATQDDILEQLNIPEASRHIASFDRKNLYLEVKPGNNRQKHILNFLKKKQQESGIIYCLSRKGTEKLAATLLANGHTAKAYHAGMTPEDRNRIQEDFVNDRVPIIVATIAFGMGIDKSNVRWVIHYNLPKNIEGYYQEIGRGGRDGLPAYTLLFYSYADIIQLRKFAKGTATEEFQLAKLERMQQYAEALSCRRIALLNYFGEHVSSNCGNCDICNAPPKYFDGTILAQKICSAVMRLKEREAPGMLVDVLRGAQNAAVLEKGYNKIKSYGSIKDIAWRDLHQYVIQLINQGVLEIRFHQGGRLLLTPRANAVLFRDEQVKLALIDQVVKEAKETFTERNSASLFEKLRSLRSRLAAEEGVPAYMIFSDASLRHMEERLPGSEEEFGNISGVGRIKQEKYALRFLKVIYNFKQIDKPKIPTHLQSLHLFKAGASVDEIAQQRFLKAETIGSHLLKVLEAGEIFNTERLITPKEFEKIKSAIESVGGSEALKSLFEYLNAEIPYWKIRIGLYLLKKLEKGSDAKSIKTIVRQINFRENMSDIPSLRQGRV
ncbi:DNA helicase RecQ [Antarcticibacterium flavum]|uniref:DNA helicase RecQ n=1 Tax=Antarcticibacterium flavum TaxID=2058175 RepID=A0A5B7X3A8_9FLAO|nr:MULTISPECIES: DNA helicase RecQ [Antarcticibacterium]MCM4161559.1 DNA helicase RecQ [Antarcticibacterium sp. W02-3]QCY69996.1 DNA helicase RecQ [Antarcticibacterium flavum]